MNTSPDVLTPHRTTTENLANIKGSAAEIAQLEREHLRDLYERGLERVQGARHGFEEYVRRKPVQSLLIAAGAGAALGFLLGRRR